MMGPEPGRGMKAAASWVDRTLELSPRVLGLGSPAYRSRGSPDRAGEVLGHLGPTTHWMQHQGRSQWRPATDGGHWSRCLLLGIGDVAVAVASAFMPRLHRSGTWRYLEVAPSARCTGIGSTPLAALRSEPPATSPPLGGAPTAVATTGTLRAGSPALRCCPAAGTRQRCGRRQRTRRLDVEDRDRHRAVGPTNRRHGTRRRRSLIRAVGVTFGADTNVTDGVRRACGGGCERGRRALRRAGSPATTHRRRRVQWPPPAGSLGPFGPRD